jgi:hypothetical protein
VATTEAPIVPAAPVAKVVAVEPSFVGERNNPEPSPPARFVPTYSDVQNAVSKAPGPPSKAGEFRPVEIREPAPAPIEAVDEFDPAIFNQMQKQHP